MHTRSHFFASLFLVLILSSFMEPISAQGSDQSEKPNFLFILADDLSYDAVRYLGNSQVMTPNIDKLAEEGISFSHCFNQGSWSGAVCVASRTMLITGQSVFRASENTAYINSWARVKNKENKEGILWGEVMQSAGYLTYMTGKWHNTDHALLKGFDQAESIGAGMYETFDQQGSSKMAYGRPKETKWKPFKRKYTGHWSPKVKDLIYDEKGNKSMGKSYTVKKHTSQLYSDKAIDFLQTTAKNSTKPFFAYVSFNAPHDPRQSPRKFVKKYPAKKIVTPKNYLHQHPFDQGDSRIRDEMLAPFPRTEAAVQLHLQEYYAIITHMDRELGRILKALEKSGKANNTYVIFTADHGLAVGQHGLMGKQNQYDHSVRVPFIIKGPRMEKGKNIDALVYMQNIYATTCELAGVDVPESVEYPSVIPMINGDVQNGEEFIFGAYKDLQRMIRSKEYKLIVYPKVGEEQLFHLTKDPKEITNLAKDPEYKEIKADLYLALKIKQEELGDYLKLD